MRIALAFVLGNLVFAQAALAVENNAPTAGSDHLLAARNTSATLNVLENDSDPDDNALTVTTAALTTTAGGSVSCVGSGDCTYTPATGFTGDDVFSYEIADGNGGTATGTVTVKVFPPVDILVYGPTSDPSGLAELTPGANVTVWDAETWSAKATSDFAAFDAIVFGDQPVCFYDTTPWDAAIANRSTWSAAVGGNTIVLGTDPDFHGKTALVQQSVLFAASGTQTGLYVALSCAYDGASESTPVDLLAGIGAFTVSTAGCANDIHKVAVHEALNGIGDAYLSNWSCSTHEVFNSWPASFAPLAIAKDAPIPAGGSAYTASDGTTGLVYMLASGATALGLSLTPATAGATTGGAHSVTAEMRDGDGAVVPDRLIRFAVTAGPNTGAAGTCSPATCRTGTDGRVSWSYTGGSTPGTDSILAYADDNANGAHDAGEPQTTAAVTWAGAAPPENRPPQANDDVLQTTSGTPVTGNVLSNDTDPDGDALTVSASGDGSHGTVTCSESGSCTYTPTDPLFTGSDTFSYSADDGRGGADGAVVTVTVSGGEPPVENEPPVAVDDELTTLVGTPGTVNVLGNDTDADGDTLAVTTLTPTAAHGSVSCTESGDCVYTSAAGYSGADSFTYTVADGNGGTDEGAVSITVEACPELGVAMSAAAGLVASERWVACSAIDANGPSLLGAPVIPPTGVELALMTSGDRALAAGAPGDSSGAGRDNGKQLRGAHDASILQLNLNVPAGNNCLRFDFAFQTEEYPEYVGSAFNDGFLAELDANTWNVEGSTISAPDNFALGPDGDIVSVNSTFFASGSVVTDTNTQYDGSTPLLRAQRPITPGAHSLYLSIFDAGDGVLDSAVFIDDLRVVAAPAGGCASGVAANRAPIALDDVLVTNEDTGGTINVLANDRDDDGDAIALSTLSPSAAHGTVSCSSAGVCTYMPAANYHGPDSFTYRVEDINGLSATGTVNVTVHPVNDAPSAVADTLGPLWVEQSGSVTVPANDSDADGDVLSVVLASDGAHGTAHCTSAGICQYTGDAGWFGADSFTYRIEDPSGAFAIGTVNVVVRAESALLLATSASSVVSGSPVTLSGKLVRAGTASGIAARPVALYRRAVGATDWTLVSTPVTTAGGVVSAPVTPTANSEYQLRHADSAYVTGSESDVATVWVKPKVVVTTSPGAAVLVGKSIGVSGTVAPAHAGDLMYLQEKVAGAWVTRQTGALSTVGAFTFTPVVRTVSGAYAFRVIKPSDGDHATSSSALTLSFYKASIVSIHGDASGDDRYNLNDEYVDVKNVGSATIKLFGWKIAAKAAGRTFTLPSYSLLPGATVRIHSGKGTNGGGHLYLKSTTPVWNDSHDTGKLLDPWAVLVSSKTY